MINVPVTPSRVRRGKAVYLRLDLPLGFKNAHPIRAQPIGGTQTVGYVTSPGFQNGMLKVRFPLYVGDEQAEFNVMSAERYLECDPWT